MKTVRELIEDLKNLEQDTPIWFFHRQSPPSEPLIDVVYDELEDEHYDCPFCKGFKEGDYMITGSV